jgi:hypothetical protein
VPTHSAFDDRKLDPVLFPKSGASKSSLPPHRDNSASLGLPAIRRRAIPQNGKARSHPAVPDVQSPPAPIPQASPEPTPAPLAAAPLNLPCSSRNTARSPDAPPAAIRAAAASARRDPGGCRQRPHPATGARHGAAVRAATGRSGYPLHQGPSIGSHCSSTMR